MVTKPIANLVLGQDPLVSIKQGLVRGSRVSDGDYSEFLGIPYALVDPENPFGAPIAHPGFEDVFEAHDDSATCPQREQLTNALIGDLDCLTVNVFVPSSASSKNKLPVMVWIYGGGFKYGTASQYVYGPKYLLQHDVILVTLNYRLGPYGFMCLDIPNVPGNAGLKDQQAALKWVQENIESFGGNSSLVTIFGQSVGAASVELHILSHGSTGLFHKAILQSGSVLNESIMIDSNPSAPLELASNLGFDAHTVEHAVEYLKNVSTDALLSAAEKIGIPFSPCVERTFGSADSFITVPPQYLLASREYESVPILMGYVDQEELLHKYNMKQYDNYFDQYKNAFFDRVYSNFNFPDLEDVDHAAKIVKDFYTGAKDITDSVDDFVNFDSDVSFYHPAERSLLYHLAKTGNPVYQYVFAYSGGLNYMKWRLNITEDGAAHSDDIGYLFEQSYMSPVEPQDLIVVDRMTTMWTNFAKYGNPTPEVTELLPIAWPAVNRETRDYLHIDRELSVQQKPFHERMAFWDLFYVAYGKYQSTCTARRAHH